MNVHDAPHRRLRVIPHYRYVGPQHQHKSTGCTGDDESAPKTRDSTRRLAMTKKRPYKTRDSTHRRAYLLTYQEPLPMLRGAPACRVFPDHLITYLYQPRCLDIPLPIREVLSHARAGRARLVACRTGSFDEPPRRMWMCAGQNHQASQASVRRRWNCSRKRARHPKGCVDTALLDQAAGRNANGEPATRGTTPTGTALGVPLAIYGRGHSHTGLINIILYI